MTDNRRTNLAIADPDRLSDGESRIDARPEFSQGPPLSQEFCELIYDADGDAENDKYYVTSADFLELREGIRKSLIQGLIWIGVGLGVVMVSIVYTVV